MKKLFGLMLLAFVGLALFAPDSASAQARWYVNEQSSGQNNGTSWADAFNDLRDALESAFWGQASSSELSVRTMPPRRSGAPRFERQHIARPQK